MDLPAECFVCDGKIRAKQQKLQCTGCMVIIHRTCSKMTQAQYREYVKDNQINRMKCDICEPNGIIQLRANISNSKRTVYSVVNNESSTISLPSDRERVSFSIGNATSSSARTQSVLNQEQSVTPVSTGIQSVTTSSVVQSPINHAAEVEIVVLPPTTGQSSLPSSTRVQSTVSTVGQRMTLASTEVQSIVSTSTVGQIMTSLHTGVQSTVSTSTVGQTTTSSPTGFQSIVSTTTVGQIMTSSPSGVQSTVSTSTVGQRTTSSTTGVQSLVSTSTVGQIMTSSSTGVQSTVSTSTVGQIMTSTSNGVQILGSTAVDGTQQNPLIEKSRDLFTSSIRCASNNDFAYFYLKADVLEQLKESKRSMKNDLAVKLRIGMVTDQGVVKDGVPKDLICLLVNGNSVPFLKNAISTHTTMSYFDVTEFLDLRGNQNRLKPVSTKKFTLHVRGELFRKKSIDDLLDAVSVVPQEYSKDFIKSKLKNDDDCEVATTNIKASLTCPIGKMRLIKPCRSKHCSHIQCVDARTILGMNQNKPVWKCPVCQQPAAYQDLYIDSVFMDILDTVPWNVMEVEFLEDGSWTHTGSDKKKRDNAVMDKENVCVMLDETIEKLDVIDLTETDEEGTPIKRTPLKTNTSLLNKGLTTVKNLLEEVTSKLDKGKEISSSKEMSSFGCQRNKRKRHRKTGPYHRGNKHFGGHISVRTSSVNNGQFGQSTFNRWSNNWNNAVVNSWNSYNSLHKDPNTYRWRSGNSGYNAQNSNSSSIFSLVFRPFNS